MQFAAYFLRQITTELEKMGQNNNRFSKSALTMYVNPTFAIHLFPYLK
jgi:hypothetical protein